MLRVQIALRVFCLALLAGAPILAHGPHELAAPEKGTPAAAIPLPAGWVESRPPGGAGALAPMLAADGDGFLATWIEPLAQAGHRVRFARWQGGSWRAATTIRESASLFANWADVPGAVRAPDGALYAWWLEKSGPDTYAYDVRLARSTDQGVTFPPLGVLHEDRSPVEHGFVSAVPERAGVRFYHLDGRATAAGGPMQLRTVFVDGEHVGPSELIDDSVCDCCSTAAAGLASGSAVAYRDRTADEIRDVQVVLRSNAAPPAMHAPGKDGWKIAGCPVNGPALAANGGELALAWFTAPGDRPRMAVARSAAGGAAWSTPETVVSAKPMGQLALAPLDAGFALAWLEGIEGGSELRLARLGTSSEPGPSQAIARTGAGRGAGIPRLAAAGKRLALLWVDSTTPNGATLRFATLPQ